MSAREPIPVMLPDAGADVTAVLQQLNTHTLLLRCLGAVAELGVSVCQPPFT